MKNTLKSNRLTNNKRRFSDIKVRTAILPSVFKAIMLNVFQVVFETEVLVFILFKSDLWISLLSSNK